MAAVARAQAALYSHDPALGDGDAMALREQLRLEAEDRARRQGELRLASKGRA